MRIVGTVYIQAGPGQLPRPLTLSNTYDLLLLMGMAVLLPILVLIPSPLLRIPFGLAAVLLAPGYALTAALFAERADLDGVARAALSFGLSVAVLPVLALALNALPWGIRPWPVALTLSLWILLLSGVSLWRRRRAVTLGAAFVPPIPYPAVGWSGLSDRTKAYYGIGGLVLVGALIGATFVLLTPDPTAHMTEFYTLGSEGLAEDYPREIAPGQEMQVRLGIANREGARARYSVLVRAEGRLLSQIGPLTIENGETWEGQLPCTLAHVGDDQQVEILLFYNDDPRPYRQLWLWVNVRPS